MKKMVICLLLALLCLLPCTTALAAETGSENNTTTPTADDPYHKGESDDNSDADDLQWYRDNAALLENNNIVGNALRSVSWSITGLVCKVANVAETLYTKTFGLIDITNYPQINDLLDKLPVERKILPSNVRLTREEQQTKNQKNHFSHDRPRRRLSILGQLQQQGGPVCKLRQEFSTGG